MSRRLRILTWHVHGSYLRYLAHTPHEFLVPVQPDRPAGYVGLPGTMPWPENLHEIPANEIRDATFDCILYQSVQHWAVDGPRFLSPQQRARPSVYLEHDPPREHPTDTRHPVADSDLLLVQVTPFNALMWDAGSTSVRIIEHGVPLPPLAGPRGELARGVTLVNNLASRGRRLGADTFADVRRTIPLDLYGMNSECAGGLGEIRLDRLPAVLARYRFFFNPIRYTSLGLAVCEAMAAALPVVALATTEMATVIENGVNGFADTRIPLLRDRMLELLTDPDLARRLGDGARETAASRFSIERFAREWDDVLRATAARRSADVIAPMGRTA
jgi:hypothetical protein